MSKFKKILSKRFPEYFIKFIHHQTSKCINYFERKSIEKDNKDWNEKFGRENYLIKTFENDVKLKLYKDSVLSKVFFKGFEEQELVFMKKVLQPGDIFLDIGANIGLYSIFASGIVGSQGRVIAFEPSPQTFKRLTENVRLNNITNIECRNIGLSEKEGILPLNLSENGYDAWNSFVKLGEDKLQNSIDVDVSTLEIELKNIEKDRISFIKIDVEGWEKFVLYGGEDFFKNYSPDVMIEFTESNAFSAGYFVQELYDIMESFGYKWYRLIEGKLHEEIKQIHYPYDNLIATKNIKALRLKSEEVVQFI